jgi:hypothetical protein
MNYTIHILLLKTLKKIMFYLILYCFVRILVIPVDESVRVNN